MSSWTNKSIDDSCEILDSLRVPVNEEERQARLGEFPYFGANGIQGYIDNYLFDEHLILIAEDGGNFETFAYAYMITIY